ncbi:MAG: hypothetical protein WD690_18760 [Vicinamibacterales bacterium]
MNDQEHDDLIDRVATALDVPEPSPLFWDHFPGRVRAAVQAAPAGARLGWWNRRAVLIALSASVAVAVASWTYVRNTSDTNDAPPAVIVVNGAPVDDWSDLDAESGWAIVTSVAESAGVEGLREAGFGVAPGGADAAIEDLTDAERAELMLLLRAEMKGDDAGGL